LFVSNAEYPILSFQYVDQYGRENPYILRVMSYNLACMGHHPNWESRVEMIAREINQLRPDVLGLQEIRYHPTYNATLLGSLSNFLGASSKNFERHMLSDLLELIPEYRFSHWQPGMKYKDGFVEGLAIVSRYPIVETEFEKLGKNEKDGNKRICLKAQVAHPAHNFLFYTTHLTYAKIGQVGQTTKLMKFINRTAAHEVPQILTGDMNILKNFQAPLSILVSQDSLKDAWRSANGEEKGFTHPSWNPKQRLDYILYRHLPDPCLCSVSGYAMNKENWPSDHCSVYADFVIMSNAS
jgi:endonuclease/exonuclease/phosphatase family metal-dependent hydrolase